MGPLTFKALIKTDLYRLHRYIPVAFLFFCFFVFLQPVHAEENTSSTEPTPIIPTSHLTIRYQDQIVFDQDVKLNTTTFHDAINNIDYPLNNTSTVFSLLINADQSSESFTLSDAQFSTWYNSFYVKCLNIVSLNDNKCNQWQYTVNGAYPGVGMDQKKLSGNENVYVYFGDRFSLNTEKIEYYTNDFVTATLKEYFYQTNEWQNTNGQAVIATEPILPDYSNYPPREFFSTSTIGGQAVFNFTTTGTYFITLPNDYWPGVNIAVTSTPTVAPTSTTSTDSSTSTLPIENPPSGGGGNPIINHNNLDVNKAIQFITAKQKDNGGFGSSDLFTDWVALAFGANNQNSIATQNIKNYLLTDPNPLVGMNEVSDYARRAMALMSLDINPYNGTKTNYINKLIEKFDGTQFGDPALFNDDIFALIPLIHAGYSENNNIIQKTVQFILSKQINGNWGSVDLTAATIQALKPLNNLSGVNEALNNAKNYLKNSQKDNGSFVSSSPSTAWTMQAIASLGENQAFWQANNKTPGDFLYAIQAHDGGVDESDNIDNRIWNTAYAIPAALSKDWNNILQNFSKVETPASGGANILTPEHLSTSTPTTTLEMTTTTIATTTINEQSQPKAGPPMAETTSTTSTVIETNTATSSLDHSITTSISINKIQDTRYKIQNDKKQLLITNYQLPVTTTNETLSPATSSVPYESTARGVFATATTLASGLGIFLAWKFLQTMI